MWRSCFGLLAGLLLVFPIAIAHGDVIGVRDTVSLAPQEAFEFRRGLHYHRMVGEVTPNAGASRLDLVVTGPHGSPDIVASAVGSIDVNHLIACCKSGNVWDEHLISLRNIGDHPVTADVRLTFLHDDFAVIAEDGEPGAWWQTLLGAILLTGIPAWIATRPLSPDTVRTRRWFWIGAFGFGGAWTLAGLLSLIGMIGFGGGPLEGFVTSHAPAPVPGLFVNSNLVSALPMIGLYVAGLTGWAIAQRRSAQVSDEIRWLGYAGAAGPLLFGTFLAIEYGNPMLAFALAIFPAGSILVAIHVPRRFRVA